jgi:hypothetical protein
MPLLATGTDVYVMKGTLGEMSKSMERTSLHDGCV